MDSKLIYIIITIIAAIAIVEFYKREQNRVTSNLHTDNLRQLLTITALEYQFDRWSPVNENERKTIESKILQLVNSYEKGEIRSSTFQYKMDRLVKKL
ncbi:hypothetical protein [Mucilaginibacter sp.]